MNKPLESTYDLFISYAAADLVVLDGRTLLYTSLDGITRSRLALVWK